MTFMANGLVIYIEKKIFQFSGSCMYSTCYKLRLFDLTPKKNFLFDIITIEKCETDYFNYSRIAPRASVNEEKNFSHYSLPLESPL